MFVGFGYYFPILVPIRLLQSREGLWWLNSWDHSHLANCRLFYQLPFLVLQTAINLWDLNFKRLLFIVELPVNLESLVLSNQPWAPFWLHRSIFMAQILQRPLLSQSHVSTLFKNRWLWTNCFRSNAHLGHHIHCGRTLVWYLDALFARGAGLPEHLGRSCFRGFVHICLILLLIKWASIVIANRFYIVSIKGGYPRLHLFLVKSRSRTSPPYFTQLFVLFLLPQLLCISLNKLQLAILLPF